MRVYPVNSRSTITKSVPTNTVVAIYLTSNEAVRLQLICEWYNSRYPHLNIETPTELCASEIVSALQGALK